MHRQSLVRPHAFSVASYSGHGHSAWLPPQAIDPTAFTRMPPRVLPCHLMYPQVISCTPPPWASRQVVRYPQHQPCEFMSLFVPVRSGCSVLLNKDCCFETCASSSTKDGQGGTAWNLFTLKILYSQPAEIPGGHHFPFEPFQCLLPEEVKTHACRHYCECAAVQDVLRCPSVVLLLALP